MRSQNSRYLVGLDHLRGFAALLIVYYHGLHLLSLLPRAPNKNLAPVWWISSNPIAILVEEGHTAVSLFMVLSGFVFSVSAVGKTVAYGPYLKNRFLRIYPLLITVMLVATAATPTSYSFLAAMQTLLFQANFLGRLEILPYTGIFWAVGVEFQFYLLFPFLHRFIEKDGIRWVVAMIVLCVFFRLSAVVGVGANAREIAYWHLLSRLDQFLIGMWSARVFKHFEARDLPWGKLSLGSVVLLMGLLAGFNHLGGWPTTPVWKVYWPTAEAVAWALVIVSYTHFAERVPSFISRPWAALGTLSYSIYLWHFPCIVILARVSPAKLAEDPNVAALLYVSLLVLPVLLPLSALSYYAVERPFMSLRVRYLSEPA